MKWYLGKNPNKKITNLLEVVAKIIDSTEIEKVQPQYQSSQITSHQSMTFNIDSYFRVCGKIVFNFLALSKGQDFVLKKEFDPIRNWIVNGGENLFVQLIDKDHKLSFLEDIPFPDLSHKIFIKQINTELIGIVSFYGTNFEALIKLSDNIHGSHDIIDGFICDWKNKKEYGFFEFIGSLRD